VRPAFISGFIIIFSLVVGVPISTNAETARWCMNTRTLTVIPDGKAHIARTKAELAILMPER
jgi:hypothetical protein